MIIVLAEITFKENITDEIITESEKLIEASLKEEGCIDYKVYNPLGKDSSFLFVEKWESKYFLETHLKQPHFIDFHKVIGDSMDKIKISAYSSEEIEL